MTDETTTLESPAPETASEVVEQNETELQSQTEQLDENGEVVQQEAAEEFDEVEHDGQKYRVPKAVSPLLMMQKDYTQKTQTLAEQRKAVESEREAFAKSMEAQRQHVKDLGKVQLIDEHLAEYQKIDWQTLRATDPNRANELFQDMQLLKDQRETLAGKVQQALETQSQEAQRDFAKRYEETNATLAKEIPGWNEAAPKVRDFATKNGVSMDDLKVIATNPVFAKLLHQAYVGSELIAKQKAATKAAAVRQPAGEAEVQPLKTVGNKPVSGAAKPGLHDSLSADEWVKRRNAQVSRR